MLLGMGYWNRVVEASWQEGWGYENHIHRARQSDSPTARQPNKHVRRSD